MAFEWVLVGPLSRRRHQDIKSGRRTVPRVAVMISFLGGGQVLAQQSQADKKSSASTKKPKLGPLKISVNWRARVEGWDWFEGSQGNSNYTLGHSLLRVAVGQTSDRFEWQVGGRSSYDSRVTKQRCRSSATGPAWPGGNLLRGQRQQQQQREPLC